MSLQWALVATFLYVEIGFIILLLLPLIPARTYVMSYLFLLLSLTHASIAALIRWRSRLSSHSFPSFIRWQKFFKSRFLASLGRQANLYFTGFLLVLVMLWVDSIREMRKYSVGREEHGVEHGHLDAELQVLILNIIFMSFAICVWSCVRPAPEKRTCETAFACILIVFSFRFRLPHLV